MIKNNILNTIGNTPLVKINKLNTNDNINIFAKLEGTNPGGSIKDRIALKMLEKAEQDGKLVKGKTITEVFIAGEDRRFQPAMARIDGSSLIVWSKTIKAPVAVRFGFSNTAIPNVFSKEGLPVNLFRTDDWIVDTSPVKK